MPRSPRSASGWRASGRSSCTSSRSTASAGSPSATPRATSSASASTDAVARSVLAEDVTGALDTVAGQRVGVAVAPGVGVGLAVVGEEPVAVATDDPWAIVAEVERDAGPRWTWWSKATAGTLVRGDVRVARCWDLVAAHCLLHGGWQASPAELWAVTHGLDRSTLPKLGQLGLL